MSEEDETAPTPQPPETPPGSPERTLVLVPIPRSRGKGSRPPLREASARVEEAVGLAHAIDLEVVGATAVPLAAPTPATLLGSGKVAELGAKVAAERIGLVIVDGILSPGQQRNLEKAWKAKVIDRTGLILEIFGERAHTREGALQVELAHLNYQKSRLVRSWTHLERQRGGFGFLGGPGETQIEADRRALEERIARIEKDLDTVVTRRRLQRQNRKKGGEGLVALVGYTNAGKSTLFNALTKAGVFADNRLFATLDPTLRKIELPHGGAAVLSDTVGFVSDLPTTLVAAFRATLEEVVEADLILHVRDIAHPDSEAQAADVAAVLTELDVDVKAPAKVIEVWNKIDQLAADRRPARVTPPNANGEGSGPAIVAVSALTGEGLPELLTLIEQRLSGSRRTYSVELRGAELASLHRLYELGEVLDRRDTDEGATLASVRVGAEKDAQFRRAFPDAKPAG
ncbi:MAG TPA: GTPase HflX [Bauldia sp.]|nr:GTPase HflX [Bauldia sp.]